MALKIERVEIRPYAFPLGLRTARGRCAVRRGWHVMLGASGHVGWGDVAPWIGFGPDPDAVIAALHAVDLKQRVIDEGLLGALPAAAAHGVEQALLDLLARVEGIALGRVLGLDPVAAVATHRLVVDADQARAAVADGAPALKLKLGADAVDADVARVARVRAVAPQAPLRLDVNGAWDRTTAARAIERLAPHAPDWIEQPLPAHDLDGFARLRADSPVPLALDESVALHREAAVGLADVAVIKPMFVGGLRRARDLAHAARAAGARVCITHALESTVGRVGALHLAAGVAGEAVHGLGGEGPCAPRGPHIPLPAGPGLGFAPSTVEAA